MVVDSGGVDQRSRPDFWPRPGRIFAAARSHTFGQLADAIDTAFARWDRAHLSQLQFADGGFIDSEDAVAVRLSALELGEKFLYEFDFGDSWTHLCTVEPRRVDPTTATMGTPKHCRAKAGNQLVDCASAHEA